MIAIAILGIVSITIFQFVDTTLRAATYSQKSGAEDAAFAGLRRLVAAQLAALPATQTGALIGMYVKHGDVRSDALQMICPAGNAVLAPDARGFYQVTLDLRETPRGSRRYALGLEREPWTDDDNDLVPENVPPKASALTATDLRPGRAPMPEDWVKLMDNVRSLEVAYFDARLNGWMDKWTDQTSLPNLVRLRVATTDRAEPYEIVTRVPGGGIPRKALAALPGVNTFGTVNTGATPSSGVPPKTVPPPPPFNFTPPAPPTFVPPAPIPGNTNSVLFGNKR